MIFRKRPSGAKSGLDSNELAAQAFARRRFGPWAEADESELKMRLEREPAYADAFRRVERSWAAVGQYATSAEIMALREGAIGRARRANARRWKGRDNRPRILRMAAAAATISIALVAAYQLAPFGLRPGEYRTNIGEQRAIELEDRSRIALDAATRLRVRFSKESRIIELLEGQAEFSVARDAGRPFKVEAGNHTIVAVGTVFTVEYVNKEIHVAMIEGKVAVMPAAPVSAPTSLTAGEELRVRRDGKTALTPKADLKAATAWREGKVIFHAEPLSEAVRRLNRYSRLQLQVDDPELAAMRISGVFDVGDTTTFVEAVQSYLPASADYSDSHSIRLHMK